MPASQPRQLEEFASFWYVPALQAVHSDAPSPEYLPEGHTSQENRPELAEYWPAGQPMHVLAKLSRYVPEMHASQAAAPLNDTNPLAHAVHRPPDPE